MSDISDIRLSYERAALDESDVARDPFAQFKAWLDEALAAEIVEPNAMTVATVGIDGQPSARIVLLRGYDERGMVFFTNYESQKGHEIATTPRAALLFFWASLERQIRIEGPVERLSAADSDAYFEKRPRGHRLSAWASPQSSKVASRAELDERMQKFDEQFAGVDVPRPEHWGGFRVKPLRFEYWQGRRNRVHDRIVFRRVAIGTPWIAERLAP